MFNGNTGMLQWDLKDDDGGGGGGGGGGSGSGSGSGGPLILLTVYYINIR
jgi:hypothetical protein